MERAVIRDRDKPQETVNSEGLLEGTGVGGWVPG